MLEEYDLLLRDKVTRISLQLRDAYYKMETKVTDDTSIPLGGEMTESIGAWPEFILRNTFCKRSLQGFCSPCFYSRFPTSNQSRSAYLNMIRMQIFHIIDNFDELVIMRQFSRDSRSERSVSMVLTPTGSFFDEHEFPVKIRLEMERRLVKIAEEKDIDIHLHIESHCEDVNLYDLSKEVNKEEILLLGKLNCKVIFGFESVNDYARNVLYNKRLELMDFESAVGKLVSTGLKPGAFVFAGLFAYNDSRTRDDVMATVSYLSKIGCFPVLMFQNAQPYTITDLLLENNCISLIEPLTVAWITAEAIRLLKIRSDSYWLIADPIGGPPTPNRHIFRKPKITCPACSKSIYAALVELRKSRNPDLFLGKFEEIRKCKCYEIYKKFMSSSSMNSINVREKTEKLLSTCESRLQQYLF